MDDMLKQAKSTGYTQPTLPTEPENGSVPIVQSSENARRDLPVLTSVPTVAVSLNSAVEVSASTLLAIQMMLGDYKEVKIQLPLSRQTSSKGKIYWCLELEGHTLEISPDGNLLVDNIPASILFQKILATDKGRHSKSKNTGDGK